MLYYKISNGIIFYFVSLQDDSLIIFNYGIKSERNL